MAVDSCRLCEQQRDLRISHFMPAGLYPKNKKLQIATRTTTALDPEQIVDRLLCLDCERRLNANGEDEVLRWLAPKAKKGKSPLWGALQTATPVFKEPEFAMYFASSIGLSAAKFAYFALSLIWRAAAHDWLMPDGRRFTRLNLGDYYDPVRRYLLDQAGFPEDTYLTMAICTDEKTPEYWMPPQISEELPGLIVAPVLGVLFRVWFGRVIPKPIEAQLFYPGGANQIFTTHCWDVLGPGFEKMFSPSADLDISGKEGG